MFVCMFAYSSRKINRFAPVKVIFLVPQLTSTEAGNPTPNIAK
jgi:hypothetical protein